MDPGSLLTAVSKLLKSTRVLVAARAATGIIYFSASGMVLNVLYLFSLLISMVTSGIGVVLTFHIRKMEAKKHVQFTQLISSRAAI